jgi:TIR domain
MIAISYRREDSMPVAGRLYDRLEQRFGKENVFMDFDSIPPGVDFRDQIENTIERSKVVIVIIGPNWLGQKSDSTRRIDDPADFVRLEVAHALQRGIPVIPVLVNNTRMPKPETLPIDIQALAFRQALPLDTGQDFRQHAERLMKRVDAIVNKPHRDNRRFSPSLLALAASSVVLLATIVVIWVKQCTPPPPGRGSETSQATATPESSPTPPTDRDKPTQLTSKPIRGNGVSKEISYYYKFNAGPGKVTVTVDGKNKPGFHPRALGGPSTSAVDVEISDLDAKRLLYIEMGDTSIDQRKVEHFELDHRQQVIMRILLSKYTLDYMVRVEGPDFSPAAQMQGPQ